MRWNARWQENRGRVGGRVFALPVGAILTCTEGAPPTLGIPAFLVFRLRMAWDITDVLIQPYSHRSFRTSMMSRRRTTMSWSRFEDDLNSSRLLLGWVASAIGREREWGCRVRHVYDMVYYKSRKGCL
jgi:hypothetical protein